MPPYPPRQATGLVTFALKGTAQVPVEVLRASRVDAGAVPFQVGNDVVVLPFTTSTAIKAKADVPIDPVLLDEYQRIIDAADLGSSNPLPYEEVVLAPDPAAPGFEPLDVPASIDRNLWIAVHATATTEDQLASTLNAVLGASSVLTRAPITLGFALDAKFPSMSEIDPCDALSTPVELPMTGEAAPGTSTLVWQVTMRDPHDPERIDYVPVTVVGDTTDSLRRNGIVSLQLPKDRLSDLGMPELQDVDLAGVADRPPALADGPQVLFWIRVFAREGLVPVQHLSWVGINAADVVQKAPAGPELVGIGTGLSQQDYALSQTPVVPATLTVSTFENDAWVDWVVVDTFAASSPQDRHLMLDAESGRIRCGDGVRGRTFPASARIRATSYEYGGGRAGVLPPGALNRAEGGVEVRNPVATAGGEEGEAIADALQRIPGEFSRHDRAVTKDDFRTLAKIPGVARVECLPLFDPVTHTSDAAGVVTVVVWPTDDPHHPDAPLPDTALLQAVCRQLDARRLVTTELFVVPPTYHPIALSVGLGIKPGYSALGVRRWVELVLRQYLSPLPPFGPDGQGWPLGHRVHAPELEAAAVQVEGVDFIEGLTVADLSSGTAVLGPVTLAAWEVPMITELTVVQGPPVEPGTGGIPRAPGPSPVPVPVPKDEC